MIFLKIFKTELNEKYEIIRTTQAKNIVFAIKLYFFKALNLNVNLGVLINP